MKKLVIAYHGTDQCKDALALGAQLAKAERAELHIAPILFYDNEAAEQERFDALFAEARAALNGEHIVEHRLREVDAAYALQELAEKIQPEVIVLGSTHRGKVGQIMLGGVGERLLNGAPCRVAVAPRGYADRDHFGAGVIGVGYDDTTESRMALDAAVELARLVGASVRLIAVLPRYSPMPARISGTDLGYSRLVREELEAAVNDAASKIDVEAEAAIEEGDEVDELAGQAVELDLLVVGSRGYGPIRRVLLGGTSTKLMRVCPCPLLITPRSSEVRDERPDSTPLSVYMGSDSRQRHTAR